MALPYEGTPPPDTQDVPTEAGPSEPVALDMALDEYAAVLPDHVQSLMGRMSKGKVYLLEESPGILHLDGQGRIMRDPRLAALAEELDQQDPTSWLVAAASTSPSPIRPNALFVRSDIIKHLSTSKVFSWTTGLGASVLGMEWLNDTTLILIFPSPASALVGLELLSKAGFDPSEGDDPLFERSAHSVPISLLPQAQLDPKDSLVGTELLTSPPPTEDGVKRKGRGTFSGNGDGDGRFDLPALVPAKGETENEWNLAEGVDPRARIAVRYAVESDGVLRGEAKQSEWYKKYGRGAGKERTGAGPRRGRCDEQDEMVSWGGRGGGAGREGIKFAKRLGRERKAPYARPSGRRTVDDLDKDLENMAKRRTGDEMDVDGGGGDGRRNGGGGRRERRGKEDLDKELDDMFAARTTV